MYHAKRHTLSFLTFELRTILRLINCEGVTQTIYQNAETRNMAALKGPPPIS